MSDKDTRDVPAVGRTVPDLEVRLALSADRLDEELAGRADALLATAAVRTLTR